jgi:hypothetical protein
MARELGSARVSKWEGKWRTRVRVFDDTQLVEKDLGFWKWGFWCRLQSAVKEVRGE